MRSVLAASLVSILATAAACSSSGSATEGDDAYSSARATLLNFEFDTQVILDNPFGGDSALKSAIEDQLLFTIGHLNGNKSVGRLDNVTLTNFKKTSNADGSVTVSYHAKLPVSWGSKTNLPTSYKFILPLDLRYSAREPFSDKYKDTCVAPEAHEVDSSSIWYYYRPTSFSCKLDPKDVTTTTAAVTVSSENTTGKFPEYDMVWEDKSLNVVAVFGKYENGKTSGDVGIDGFNNYVAAIRGEFKGAVVTTTPTFVPANPGVANPDVEIRATLPSGLSVKINALLVDEVSSAPQTFYARYEALSTDADVIAYNGHAGLGQNVRALTSHGKFKKGKYVIVFMNGCDTFAYVDGSLAAARAKLNPDDPTGTKYMEFVTNSMPAFFSQMPTASIALMRGLLKVDAPMTYEQIFANVSSSQVVVVTGEEDNTYTPTK